MSEALFPELTIYKFFYFHLAKKKLFVYLRPDFAELKQNFQSKFFSNEKNVSTIQKKEKE